MIQYEGSLLEVLSSRAGSAMRMRLQKCDRSIILSFFLNLILAMRCDANFFAFSHRIRIFASHLHSHFRIAFAFSHRIRIFASHSHFCIAFAFSHCIRIFASHLHFRIAFAFSHRIRIFASHSHFCIAFAFSHRINFSTFSHFLHRMKTKENVNFSKKIIVFKGIIAALVNLLFFSTEQK